MNIKLPLQIIVRWWLLICVAFFALTVCAASPAIVNHHFEFDAVADSPDVEILDYKYGDSKIAMASNPDYIRKEGRSLQATGIYGAMRVGDSLYVKWRIKRNGQVCEDTVDLRGRLPADITDDRLYFIVKGAQLYVYLILPKKRPADVPPDGPRVYRHLRTITIYPDQPKP